MERKDRRPKLSKREIELLELAGKGLTDSMIGDRLDLECSTIATYWARIRLKMQASSRTEAVAIYYRMEVDRLNDEVRALREELDMEHRIDSDSLLFSEIVQVMPIGVAVCDPVGTIKDRNPHYAAITQFPAQAPTNISFDSVHQDQSNQPGLSNRLAIIERTHANQSCFQGIEWYFNPTLGKLVSYLLQAIPMRKDQGDGAILLVLQEILNPSEIHHHGIISTDASRIFRSPEPRDNQPISENDKDS
jgi:DNA-binding CsgD family transcriptional regulator